MHLSDFVEKKGSSISQLELAGFGALGAGEGSGFVAEELAFEQVVGNGGAVDLDERIPAAVGAGKDEASGNFFADAALSTNEYGSAGGGDLLDGLAHLDHVWRGVEELQESRSWLWSGWWDGCFIGYGGVVAGKRVEELGEPGVETLLDERESEQLACSELCCCESQCRARRRDGHDGKLGKELAQADQRTFVFIQFEEDEVWMAGSDGGTQIDAAVEFSDVTTPAEVSTESIGGHFVFDGQQCPNLLSTGHIDDEMILAEVKRILPRIYADRLVGAMEGAVESQRKRHVAVIAPRS